MAESVRIRDLKINVPKKEGVDGLTHFVDKLVDSTENIWREEPLNLREFMAHEDHMGLKRGKGLPSEEQFNVMEDIIGPDPKMIFDPDSRTYTIFDWIMSKGSGKDSCAAWLKVYVVYTLLLLKNPQAFLGFASHHNIDLVNIATAGDQADRAYFNKVAHLLINWPWLLRTYSVRFENRKLSGGSGGTVTIGNKTAIFPNNIRLFSLNSNNESWEGFSIVMYVLDELSGLITPKEKVRANNILQTAETSSLSRRSNKFCGFGIVMGFPRQEEDILFDLEELAQKPEGSHIKVVRKFAWEMKPFDEFYCGEWFDFFWKNKVFKVPIELKQAFNRDPEGSAAKFLLEPTGVSDPFITYSEKILECVHNYPYILRTQSYPVNVEEFEYLHKRIVSWNHEELIKRRRYVIHVDAAEGICDAALSIGYGSRVMFQDVDGLQQTGIRVKIMGHYLWQPDRTKKMLVSLTNIDKFLADLFTRINVAFLSFDHWNSAASVEKARKARIKVERHNITIDDYRDVRGLIYSNLLELPDKPIWIDPTNYARQEPMSYRQLRMLGKEGNRISNPSERKDLADSIAGVVRGVLKHKIISADMGDVAGVPLGVHGLNSAQVRPIQDIADVRQTSGDNFGQDFGSTPGGGYPSVGNVPLPLLGNK